MVGAYSAERFFAESNIKIAEVRAVQKGAAIVFFKDKMCAVTVDRDAFGKTLTYCTANRAVSFERIFVNAYFPAAAAGITAFIGNALEARVVIGVKKPFSPFCIA